MVARVTNEQVKAVEEFKAAYPRYSNEDILEIAATPRFIPQMYKEAHGLKVVTLNELALILNGHYELIDDLQQVIENNSILSAVQDRIQAAPYEEAAKKAATMRLRAQTAKGIEKYGEAVNVDNLSVIEWLTHALEETADKQVYMEAVLLKLKSEMWNSLRS